VSAGRAAAARPVPPARAGPGGATAPGARPATDAWAWLTLLAVVPLAARMAGAPWGEPVAEDFDFLRRALLEGTGSLLDGGGSQAFWRPIPHQLYYAALGRVILAAPAVVAVFHLGCLALAALLFHRALRPHWGGPLSCLAATFPLLAESTRTIASWPTQFVDVGLALAGGVAVFAASRGRHAWALAGLGLALLCKEVAVVAGVLLPFVPGAARDRRERLRFAAGVVAVLAAWGLATLLVRRSAGLALPAHIVRTEEALSAGALERLGWALTGNLRAAMSLPRLPAPEDLAVGLALAALAALAAVLLLARRDARLRLARLAPWGAWGLAWFALGTAAITPIYPAWQPNRSHLASTGLGLAATAALGSAHPSLAVVFAGLRLVLLARAPGPERIVSERPPDSGAFMDYARLTRLQVFMRAARQALARDFPTLSPGAVVVQQNLPLGVEYAFGGDHALQAWYRDPSLRWRRLEEFRARPDPRVVVVLQAEPGRVPPVALVHPEALLALFEAQAHVHARRFPEALAALDRADPMQQDTFAVAFRVKGGAMRAYALVSLGRPAEAQELAGRLLALDRKSVVARQVLALALAHQARFESAFAHLDTLRAVAPADSTTQSLREEIRALVIRAGAAPPARAGP
jgi:tetratricopeptide (TPR) repeat protein